MVTDPIRRAKWHSSVEERVIVGYDSDDRVVACVPGFVDRCVGFRVAVSTSPGKGCNFAV